jgi:class I fructose-bisphosphate aldolase
VIDQIVHVLGEKAEYLLTHASRTFVKEVLHLPGADFIERIFFPSDRNNRVLGNLNRIYHHGRLSGTGYLSILPVDQGVEHSAGASFAANPKYFDPENIVELAIEGGCNAVASTFGVLGAVAVGATIYFGSEDATREIVEISELFALAHELGMVTVLWCYLRNSSFAREDGDYHLSADLTGQANYLGSTIQADIIKQKLPENNGGFLALEGADRSYGKSDKRVYLELTSKHPIDLCRYQVANCFMGRIGLINSGGASGKDDFSEAIYTAVVNKRAGGQGLISGRKAFQRSMREGIDLLRAIQDVYLCEEVTIA